MIGMLTVPMMMLPGLVGLPGRGSIGYYYSFSLPATNMASLPDDASQDEQRVTLAVTLAEEPRRSDVVSRKVLRRNKEGGKSLGVGGRKQFIDFCQYTIRLSPIFKAFVSEK